MSSGESLFDSAGSGTERKAGSENSQSKTPPDARGPAEHLFFLLVKEIYL